MIDIIPLLNESFMDLFKTAFTNCNLKNFSSVQYALYTPLSIRISQFFHYDEFLCNTPDSPYIRSVDLYLIFIKF